MGKLSKLKDAVEAALDMSKAARDARALEQGYSPNEYYHATMDDFDSFDNEKIGSRFNGYSFGHHFTSNPNEANVYASDKISNALDGNFPDGAQVMPTRLRYENPLIINTDYPAASMEADLNRGDIIRQVVESRRNGKPYDAVVIKRNRGDEWDHENVVVFDPSNIRSVNAAFDPDKKDSANLLASLGGATVAGGAAMTPEEAEAAIQQQQRGEMVSQRLSDFANRRAAKQEYWTGLKDRVKRRGGGARNQNAQQEATQAMLEAAAAVNRGAADTVDFVGSQVPNAVLNLIGSDQRVNSIYDIPGMTEATEGNYMDEGSGRDAIRFAGEILSPL